MMHKASIVPAILLAATAVLSAHSALALPASDVIAKHDTDNDKTLDLNEVKTAAAAHFDRLEKDSDQTLDAKEAAGAVRPGTFKAADTDHDGTLSKDEYLALVEKLFNKADVDHDGTLTAAELKTKTDTRLRHLID